MYDWGYLLPPDAYLMHGGAKGVDSVAAAGFLASHDQAQELRRPADWERHGRSAGHRRNEAMAEEAFQYLVTGGDVTVCAFHSHGSRGTAGMIECCLARLLTTNIRTPGIDGWEVLKP